MSIPQGGRIDPGDRRHTARSGISPALLSPTVLPNWGVRERKSLRPVGCEQQQRISRQWGGRGEGTGAQGGPGSCLPGVWDQFLCVGVIYTRSWVNTWAAGALGSWGWHTMDGAQERGTVGPSHLQEEVRYQHRALWEPSYARHHARATGKRGVGNTPTQSPSQPWALRRDISCGDWCLDSPLTITFWLPWWLSGKEPTCQCRRLKRHRFNPWVGKIPWSRKWQHAPVFLLGKFHVQRSLVGCSPQGPTDWATEHALTVPKYKVRQQRHLCTPSCPAWHLQKSQHTSQGAYSHLAAETSSLSRKRSFWASSEAPGICHWSVSPKVSCLLHGWEADSQGDGQKMLPVTCRVTQKMSKWSHSLQKEAKMKHQYVWHVDTQVVRRH